MTYESFLPGPALREFVRNYTIIDFQFKAGGPVPIKQRSPKPEQKIVFYLKDLPVFENPATGSILTPPPVSVFSHQSAQKNIRMSPEFSALIIFLQPGVLHRLIRLPMMELAHECYDAELFFGTAVRDVRDQMASAPDLLSMIEIAEKFILEKCHSLPGKSSMAKIALHLLRDPTSFTLEEVARQACLSSRQFYRNFTDQIGISPKLYSRLSRFNHAYRYRINHANISWSSIAQEFRYTDYHHMEKEFKSFTGLTPEDWTKIHLAAPERILKLR
ncbi:AraC family transcriptional regulator [Flavitalea antarctica]